MSTYKEERGGLLFRFVVLAVFVATVAILALLRYPILGAAGRWLVVNDPLAHADAIIVLSGDDVEGDRAARAADLYKAGWAPVIVASGSQIRSYLSETDLTARDLAQDGVSASAIIRFPQNDLYTLAEARDLRRLCIDRHWHAILVVTSNFHTRRARYIFRDVFPATISVRVTASADSNFNPASWWQTRRDTKTLAREYAALSVAFWELHAPS